MYLVELRASQINGCSIFVDVRSRELKLAGDPDERIFSIAACREAPYYSDEERAALALTEAATPPGRLCAWCREETGRRAWRLHVG